MTTIECRQCGRDLVIPSGQATNKYAIQSGWVREGGLWFCPRDSNQ